MLDPSFAIELFNCWLATAMWPSDFYDLLAGIDNSEEHY